MHHEDTPRLKIKETYLSRKPAARAVWIAIWSCLGLIILSNIYWSDLKLGRALDASGTSVFTRHEYWRLFTTLGVHADFKHLGANLVLFSVLSYMLSAYYSLWIYPGLLVLVGAATNALALSSYPPEVTLVGASGLVYAMAGFWLAMYFGIERGLSAGQRLLRCAGFTLMLLMPSAFEPVVSYRTHAIGYLLGAIAGAAAFLGSRAELRALEVWVPVLHEPPEPSEPPEPPDESETS